MRHLSLEDFVYEGEQMDSLYRLVNIAARRANQLNKLDSRSLLSRATKKPVIAAIDEILEGKVWYRKGEEDEDEYNVG